MLASINLTIIGFSILASCALGDYLSECLVGENTNSLIPSCQNSYKCFWDLSRCSRCANSNCVCSTYNGCDTCKEKMYLNSDSQCVDCPEGCATCCTRQSLTALICSSCTDGYVLIGGVCVGEIGCKERVGQSNKCHECLDGYYLDKNLACKACHKSCATCRTRYDCIECQEDFIRSTEFPAICVSCTEGVNCNGSGTETDNSKCKVEQLPPNCEVQTYNQYERICKCIRCKKEFYLSRQLNLTESEQCVGCPVNVQRCSSKTDIIECASGYILDLKDQQCYSNDVSKCRRLYGGNCTACHYGYYLEYDSDLGFYYCYSYITSNCETYTNKGTQCSLCSTGYYLNSNKQCISCNVGLSPSTCSACENGSECQKCLSNYHLINGACEKCKNSNCSECNSAGECTTCASGYGYNTQSQTNDDECIACQPGCNKCDYDFRKCTVCKDGYFNLQFVCKQIPENCVTHSNGFCTLCKETFIAKGGLCSKCSSPELGIFNCPSSCSDDEITLVEKLSSSPLSLLFSFFLSLILILF